MNSCEQADHEYGTLRVMGSTGFDLMQHAEECKQEKWHHALPTELWSTVENRRRRYGLRNRPTPR